MKLYILSITFLLVSFSLSAQYYLWQYADQLPDTGCYESPTDMAVDSDGNCYITGFYINSVIMGDTLLAQNNYGRYISKIDCSGNWIWSRQPEGSGYSIEDIYIDSNDVICLVAKVYGPCTFGSYTIQYGTVLAKLDTQGNWISATTVISGTNASVLNMALDTSGSLIVAGIFTSTIQLGSFTLSGGEDWNPFIAKMYSNGTWAWAIQASSTDVIYLDDMDINQNGDCFITGDFRESATIGAVTLTSNGSQDCFVAKIDPAGNINWAINVGSLGHEKALGIEVSASGGCIVTGWYNGLISFGSLYLSATSDDNWFIAKVSSNGVWQWATKAGSSYCNVTDFSTDANGNTIIVGYFRGTLLLGGNTYLQNSTSYIHPFLAKLNTSGTVTLAISGSDSGSSYDFCTDTDATGNIFLYAAYSNAWSLGNTSLSNNGIFEIIIAKLSSTGNPIWVQTSDHLKCNSSGNSISHNSNSFWVAGSFKGKVNINGLLASSTTYDINDIWVTRVGAYGSLLWQRLAGGAGDDQALGIINDSAGNCYMTGYFSGHSGFGDDSLFSSGAYDIFISKLDADGNWLWSIKAGGQENDYGKAIGLDNEGNIYIAGTFSANAQFGNTNLTSSGGSDIFIAKLSSSGNWMWVVNAGGVADDDVSALAVNSTDIIHLTGSFSMNATFGNLTLNSLGMQDVFVAKLVNGSNWQQVIRFGGPGNDVGYGICLDHMGNIFYTGGFSESASFGSQVLNSSGGLDVFISKLASNYNNLWSVRAGGVSDDIGKSICLSSNGTISTTGNFQEQADFGGQLLNSFGMSDFFVCNLSSAGNWIYSLSAGGAGNDNALAVTDWNESDAVVTGFFSDNITFSNYMQCPDAYQALIGFAGEMVHNSDETNPVVSSSFEKVYPNPFSASATIKFTLNKPGNTTVRIYNLKGQLVKSLADDYKKAGNYSINWSGDSDYGKPVANGIYFARLQSVNEVKSVKLVLLR